MLRRLLRFLLNLVKTILILFLIFMLCSCSLYFYIINKDNFVNRNNLQDIEAVEQFLDAELPSREVSFEAVKLFVETQELECNFDAREDVNTHPFTGSIRCRTPVSNPAFYGHRFPSDVGEVMFRLIADDPVVRIIFFFREDFLVNIQTSFFIYTVYL